MFTAPKRKRWTAKRRLELFRDLHGICYLCGFKIDATREAWDIEHEIPLELGGADDTSNWRLAHKKDCHSTKTKTDQGKIAKAKRVEAKRLGATRSRNPLPGGRNSKWKRKMDGTWVRRDE